MNKKNGEGEKGGSELLKIEAIQERAREKGRQTSRETVRRAMRNKVLAYEVVAGGGRLKQRWEARAEDVDAWIAAGCPGSSDPQAGARRARGHRKLGGQKKRGQQAPGTETLAELVALLEERLGVGVGLFIDGENDRLRLRRLDRGQARDVTRIMTAVDLAIYLPAFCDGWLTHVSFVSISATTK